MQNVKRLVILGMILALISGCQKSQYEHPTGPPGKEKSYQNAWCPEHNGRMEVIFPDKTRCDCLTQDNAIEFDFAKKWYEALGQALYYGLQSGKRPGVVLIMEKPSDRKYWIRLNTTIQYYNLPVDTWMMEGQAIKAPASGSGGQSQST